MANLELTSDIEAGPRLVVIPEVVAVGFCALPSKSRALAEDFSVSLASASQAAPVYQESVQNLLHALFLQLFSFLTDVST